MVRNKDRKYTLEIKRSTNMKWSRIHVINVRKKGEG